MSWEDAPPAVVSIVTGAEVVRQSLVDALTSGRRVRLTYDGGARGDTTQPLVDPAAIVVRDGYAYLEAWSLERDSWRSYRLDRIQSVQVLEDRSTPHGEPPQREDWLSDSSVPDVTLRVTAAARWISEYYPVAHTAGDLVTLRVSEPGWLRQLILRLGAEAEVVYPLPAQDEAVQAARDALAQYEAWSLRPDPAV